MKLPKSRYILAKPRNRGWSISWLIELDHARQRIRYAAANEKNEWTQMKGIFFDDKDWGSLDSLRAQYSFKEYLETEAFVELL